MTHDICDPPPAPIVIEPPARPLNIKASDFVWLAASIIGLAVIAFVLALRIDPDLGILIGLGGALVVAESFITSMQFLSRDPNGCALSPGKRCAIFLAALTPWLAGLGLAALLMTGLFALPDFLP